jgi:hypothetical protein
VLWSASILPQEVFMPSSFPKNVQSRASALLEWSEICKMLSNIRRSRNSSEIDAEMSHLIEIDKLLAQVAKI